MIQESFKGLENHSCDFQYLRFLELLERKNMPVNLNYVAWENSLKLTWSKKESYVCEALFFLK